MTQEVKIDGRPAKLLWREAYTVGAEFLDNPGTVETFDVDELAIWARLEAGRGRAGELIQKLPQATPEQLQQVAVNTEANRGKT